MTRTRPTMASHRLDLPSICDICGKDRSTRKHAACSRTRQQLKQDEWADALHDYEELGMAVNLNHARNQDAIRRQREAFARMVGVKNQTRSTSDRQAITHIVQQMAGELGIPYQLELDS